MSPLPMESPDNAEICNFSLDGKSVIVRNTFVHVLEELTSSSPQRRCKSAGGLRERAPSDVSLAEIRRRVFTCGGEGDTACCEDAAELRSNASTQLPSSTLSPSMGRSMSLSSGAVSEETVQIPADPAVRASFVASRCDSWARPSWACMNDAAQEEEVAQETGSATTLMFRNLPDGFSRPQLEQLLDVEGYAGRYDFIYLPAELATGACFGYAFVNLVSSSDMRGFIRHFQGFDHWPVQSSKKALIHASEGIQGLEEQIERYRNSPLMHPSVADGLRPTVYREGKRATFPNPTAPLKPPRVRAAAKRKEQVSQQTTSIPGSILPR